ncbi:MAG: HEAT repeat domain-containing protein, partial [Anaerolineae bacterium]|nr:HEAT repeat domain-containing protein [Anaerolineae bacterium]
MPLFGPPNVEKLKAKRDVAGLVKALKSPNWEVRRNAATALGEIGDRQAVEALIASLQDPEGAVRHHAVVALGKLGDRRALPALRTMLFAVRLANKLDSSVETIIEALGSIGDRSVVQDLVPCLDDGYDRNVRATLKALGSIAAPSAIPPLLRYARTAPGSMRGPLADAFARIGAPAVEPLVASLAEKEGGWAASALAQIGAPAVGALLAASKSGQEVVQERAIRALVQIRPPAVDALLSAFESGKGPVRQRALEALAELGSQDDRVVEALATAFHADDDALRRLAAAGLARIPGRRTAELLTAALAGEDGAWRAEIARLLGNNKRGDTAAALFPLLHDPETRVRLSAIRGLPRVSRASKEERAALVSMLQEKDMQIRQASAEALASLGLAPTDPEGLAWFVNAREKAPLAQRASAVATLVGLGLAL